MAVYSGDTTAGDGIYTRKIFLKTPMYQNDLYCVDLVNKYRWGYTFTTWVTPTITDPSATVSIPLTIQAIDQAGTLTTSPEIPVAVQGTSLVIEQLPDRACGEPTGNGGCFPGY